VFLNGATRLDAVPKTLLIADSVVGSMWEVNVKTRSYKLGVQIPELARLGAAQQPVGVNRIKVHDGYLYFTNLGKGTLGRVLVNTVSGAVTGPANVLVSGIQPDDFTIGRGGSAWIVQSVINTLSVLLRDGTVVDVLGSANELTIGGPTASLFGKKDQLFCTTNGGFPSRVNGTSTGRRVMEIDTGDFDL
jgi:streptogramin lyase